MKSEKNILIAFILNFAFSIFEFVGGFFTGSVAIVSDAVHDIGDAASIGISYFLEKKSKKKLIDNPKFVKISVGGVDDEAFIKGHIRKRVLKATDIKPVTLLHIYQEHEN